MLKDNNSIKSDGIDTKQCYRCSKPILETDDYGIVALPISDGSKIEFVALCGPCSDIVDNL